MATSENPKVKIRIKAGTPHFTDEGGQLFAPGEWNVTPDVSMRLIANGRATLVGGPAKAPAKEPPKPPGPGSRIPPSEEPEETTEGTPLPEGFPCQATLAAAGYTTVESLKAPNIKEKLEKVEGLTGADVTKIGLAISKV